jgi:hypothetical protein
MAQTGNRLELTMLAAVLGLLGLEGLILLAVLEAVEQVANILAHKLAQLELQILAVAVAVL